MSVQRISAALPRVKRLQMLKRVDILARARRPPEMVRDGCSHKFFCATDCIFKFQSAGETGGNPPRVRAASPVRFDSPEKRRPELANLVTRKEQIPGVASGKVSPLYQNTHPTFL